jgi:hypothetical protein
METLVPILFLLVGCAPSEPPTVPEESPTPGPSPVARLVYTADFNHQRCAPSEINCGARNAGDPCTVEGESCVKSCATEVLICKKAPPAGR